MSVVVVGGGTSGLAAAVVLEQAGTPCLVLEKREFPGGRIAARERDGFRLDLGAQFMFKDYPATREMARRLGIADEFVEFSAWLAVFRDGCLYELNTDLAQNFKEFAGAFRARRLLSVGGRLQAGRFLGRLLSLRSHLDFDHPEKALDLDAVSFADYVREGFGEELLEYVAQPIAGTLTLGEPEEISAAHGLALSLYMLRGLSMFRKGIGFLAEEMSRAAGEIRLGADVRRIVVEDGRVKGVRADTGAGEELIEADHVICTAPANLAAELLGDLPASITDALRTVRYSSCLHVMFGLQGRPFGKDFAIALPRREGFGFPGLTENSLKASCAPDGCGMVHVYTNDRYAAELLELTRDEVRLRVAWELQKIEPSFPEEPLFCETFYWPEALCLAGPGHFARMEALKESVRGFEGLHLAGEYLGIPSMEAAIDSGMRAAEAVLG
ncbi:MAG: FAD-dependent oxidoreductase [Actinobacteria bacterium]|nr:FAD-dependent oxidoreductase [Actinomycetota bacterium]MBU1942036.1 FAD-dependent oxidoreductase [Actinomycetota bacterium]MBU2687193.1 FAD-dependent oxidoreductase [Actinomycetota bacterium]